MHSYDLIACPAALERALDVLKAEPTLAVDFEMENHSHHYGLRLALIQIATPNRPVFIIDVPALDPTPLGALLADPTRELIVHDADFDKRACHQLYGWRFGRLFDTRIAAQFCGYRQFGLAGLSERLLGLHTDKRFQRIDWLRRPIRPEALDYAAHDAASLFALKERLRARLVELGRLAWAEEEFALQAQPPHDAPPAPAHVRIKRSAALTPRQLGLLRLLTEFRDRLARSLDRPVHYVARDEVLLAWALTPPTDAEAIGKTLGLHPALRRGDALRQLLELLRAAPRVPEEQHPLWQRSPPPPAGFAQRLKAMQAWRVERAQALDLEPHLLLANDVLQWCARHPDQAPPPEVEARVRAWQKTLLWPDFLCSIHQSDLRNMPPKHAK